MSEWPWACWHIWCTLSLGSALQGRDIVNAQKTGQSLVSLYLILRSCGVHYRNISGIYLKLPPGLHHANHHVFQYWIYIILMAVILISMYQCWAVLTVLWELAGFGSYIMLWEPDWFFNIYIFTGENCPGYQDF